MGLTLYYTLGSPPVRAVLFALKTLQIPHHLKRINILKGEQYEEEYLKANPQHTIPMLDDDGFKIWDSHAINAYLCTVYGKDDKLYPKDPKKRAVVDQRLHFDSGVFAQFRNIVTEYLTTGITGENSILTDSHMLKVREAYDFTEKFLHGKKYFASDDITIADFSIVTTLTTIDCLCGEIKNENYPLLRQYLKRCEENFVNYAEINEAGIEEFKFLFRNVASRLPKSSL